MLRIMAVCGSGLGTSFMVEMNIQSILKDLGVADQVTVSHTDLGNASAGDADVWIAGKDLENSVQHLGDVRILNSIIDMDELRTVIEQVIEEKGIK
ncbi:MULTISPECIES: PTS sugar transporter subunit IIB [Aerococcus]|uniref:PTS sugar transporter subunit IIB n=1 Tax=Aerococcus mictus TaxID=2976810 RepID=A0A1E9PLQ6_9LACT|nr:MULTISPECIES: PTS sugar transporter subunit IIB [Aerococcus]AEA00274.1 PTS system, Lactose/Cellobiose specific IIB subunit [Aerococcus sp. Group 1]KAA9290297.1 PTS sugar transporter subunit IIB [Aerococcus mictus]MBU5611211.1 PTS sugar transporter subunit IIB [Aerococcus urinae]MCY3031503.1 PTS sugar transporter subunit IIB [Aerococcus sp. Group 1]MCY3039806.1 PTS sugar transporter subunit IIB [Aerococcus sp. Group 2]